MIMVKVIKRKKFIINNMKNKKIRQYSYNQGRYPSKEKEIMFTLLLAGKLLLITAIAGLLINMFIW